MTQKEKLLERFKSDPKDFTWNELKNELAIYGYEELKTAFAESVDDYMETCRELGKEPDKSYKGSFNVCLNNELHRQAALLASGKQLTLNELVKKSISYIISHEEDLDNYLVKN